eukprot:5171585-Pleurochrysis_carterae.AAC.1
MLAWAATVHKSQGLTLRQVLFDSGHKEPNNSIGISFVALTRVRHPAHMAFSPLPTLERFTDEIARKLALHIRRMHEYQLRQPAAVCAQEMEHLQPPTVYIPEIPAK